MLPLKELPYLVSNTSVPFSLLPAFYNFNILHLPLCILHYTNTNSVYPAVGNFVNLCKYELKKVPELLIPLTNTQLILVRNFGNLTQCKSESHVVPHWPMDSTHWPMDSTHVVLMYCAI
jgi:hypothetical protein